MHGGIADNVVPEDCHFHYEFRNLPGSDALAMQARLTDYAASLQPAMQRVDPGNRVSIRDAVRDAGFPGAAR